LEEGGLDGFGLVRYEINEVLVGYGLVLAGSTCLREAMLTLQEALDVVELAGIV
jgi:hypothetical protein